MNEFNAFLQKANPCLLVCQNAWKGTLSPNTANALFKNILSNIPLLKNAQMSFMPLSDGGDGWMETLVYTKPNLMTYPLSQVIGPYPPLKVTPVVYYDLQEKTSYLESSSIHGMRLLTKDNVLNPLKATSYGVGEAIEHIFQRPPGPLKHLIVSVGGSSSIDGGLGALQALGWRLYGPQQQLIQTPVGAGHLAQITKIEPPQSQSKQTMSLGVITDVSSQFLEAPRLFGPQKGATPHQVQQFTQAFEHLLELYPPFQALAQAPGSGAAGGLPLALMAHFGNDCSPIYSGCQWLLDNTTLEQAIQACDLCITGEGRFDQTSLFGKATGLVIQLAIKYNKPVWVCCGQVDETLPWPERMANARARGQLRFIETQASQQPLGLRDPQQPDQTQALLKQRLEALLLAIGPTLA